MRGAIRLNDKTSQSWRCLLLRRLRVAFMLRYWIVFSLAAAHLAGAAVIPPVQPVISRELEDEEIEKLPHLQQSPQLQQELGTLQTGTLAERIAVLKRKTLADLVWFEGGTFTMGDWAHWVGKQDSLPAHEVTLSGFSMGRYKVTQAEYEVFKQSKGLKQKDVPAGPLNAPVEITWQEGRDYCLWLGGLTGQPFDYPTEAQWEYAARSRGQKFAFSTDDGNLDKGRNLPGAPTHQRILAGERPDGFPNSLYPVGLFPPSPMGMYDMSHNGMEWVKDWYDAHYYEHSPKNNPQGPLSGKDKVARAWPLGDSIGIWAVTLTRRNRPPQLKYPSLDDQSKWVIRRWQFTARCVVNVNKALMPVTP